MHDETETAREGVYRGHHAIGWRRYSDGSSTLAPIVGSSVLALPRSLKGMIAGAISPRTYRP